VASRTVASRTAVSRTAASSRTAVSRTAASMDKFRGHFFGFASSWTKMAHADKLKGRECILLFIFSLFQQKDLKRQHSLQMSLEEREYINLGYVFSNT
jgi:hypothetical protein